ncbi:hypothetical protein RLDS_23650 [Sphingobium lactosutens DS20]|uniref:CoA transferase n=1 Tax=Sphingobium lactosutens DS20 TaxID=1331060 RepID=T0H506_9SPHN|nr:hypothetical protein RLDS_23650 [Sphingobium lactosutens DS20]
MIVRRPLEGVRVVELARILAGPWAGQLLADLGAEVIKVERPGCGDDTRGWGPPFITDSEGAPRGAAYFHACNRGKRSVAIDFTNADGQAEVRELVRNADIVIENFKVGSLTRYGLDHASLLAVNPRLITCSVTGFGQTGPYAPRAGYDFIIQAMGGAMSLTGEPDGEPQKAGVAYADIFTGMYATVAILAALRERDLRGVGAHLDLALLDCQVAVLANQALNYFASGTAPRRLGNGHPNLVPYQLFKTSDGELIIAVGNDRQFEQLCHTLGLAALSRDPRFSTNAGRVEHRTEVVSAIEAATRGWTMHDLAEALEVLHIPCGPVNDLADVFADPQVIARGLAIEQAGVPGLASPIVVDGERMIAQAGAPKLP